MGCYLVFFYYVGDNNPVWDSVWTIEAEARGRVGSLKDYDVDSINIENADWEPVAFNSPGYSKEELE